MPGNVLVKIRLARAILMSLLASIVVSVGAGCGSLVVEEKSPIPASSDRVKLTLYFGDAQGVHLLPEEREVIRGDHTLPELVLWELIKGPRLPDLSRTIPEGTRLLAVNVKDGVACVDFSLEFQSKHWGGSTGEAFTLNSVVNSLAMIQGIDRVQFLLEGENTGSILGHADTSQPLLPNWQMIKKQ